jgi:hypothetical protein
MLVRCVCVCVEKAGTCLLRTYTHLTNISICGHIYHDFIITTQHYIVFYHFNKFTTSANTTVNTLKMVYWHRNMSEILIQIYSTYMCVCWYPSIHPPRRYNQWRVLADSSNRLQPSLSLTLILQFLTPNLSASFVTPSIQVCWYITNNYYSICTEWT